MGAFSDAELAYLTGEAHLGQLATVDQHGQPYVVPVGWSYNPELDTIDVGGHDFGKSAEQRPRLAGVSSPGPALVATKPESTDWDRLTVVKGRE